MYIYSLKVTIIVIGEVIKILRHCFVALQRKKVYIIDSSCQQLTKVAATCIEERVKVIMQGAVTS